MNLILKKTTLEDLETLFLFQAEAKGIQMAAFTSENPSDKIAYMAQWTKIVQNPNINMKTIFVDDTIVGNVAHFEMMGDINVSYWIGQAHWNKGIATKGLQLFLEQAAFRPLVGRVAFDNIGSQKVLEKCGFVLLKKENGFANARKKEIEEFVYILEK